MKKFLHESKRSHVVLTFCVTFALLCVLWQIASTIGGLPAYIVPSPVTIADKLVSTYSLLQQHALVTLGEILIGFASAIVGAILFAVCVVFFKPVERVIYPWLVILQVIPKVAIGPLLVLWLGFGFMPKAFMAFLLSFFPIMIAAIIGLRSLDGNAINLLRSMGAGRVGIFRYMQLPNALPQIFGSLKVGVTLAVVGALVGEFVGGSQGLGYVLVSANGTMDTPLLFVSLVWISALSLVLYGLVASLERTCVSWHVSFRDPLSALKQT